MIINNVNIISSHLIQVCDHFVNYNYYETQNIYQVYLEKKRIIQIDDLHCNKKNCRLYSSDEFCWLEI